MSATSPFNKKYIGLSQSLMILMALASSFFPKYFFDFYILYFLAIMAFSSVMMYRNNPMLRDRKYMTEAARSRTLYEEKNVESLIQSDKEYLEQTMKQATKMFKNLFIYILFIIIAYIVYTQGIDKIIAQPNIVSSPYEKFGIFLGVYELFFIASFSISRSTGMYSMAGSMSMAPKSYKITDKGVVATDKSSTIFHAIHLKEAEITINREKKYVEISPKGQRSVPYKLRLYTNDVDRVSELLKRLKTVV